VEVSLKDGVDDKSVFCKRSGERFLSCQKSCLRVLIHDWMNWLDSIFTDLRILLLMLVPIEPIFPEWTRSWVCLMFTTAVRTFEWVRIWLALFSFKMRGVGLHISFATPAKFAVISNLWGPLHLTHLDPCILHEKVKWPYLQQFSHWGILGLALAPLMVAMNLPTLKHLLIRFFAFIPLWVSHMSI